MPITYNEAKAAGTLDKYKWSKWCDTTTGYVALPILDAAPCVPEFTGDNGGATAPGVTADSINIVYYKAKPDPQFDTLAKRIGAYDAARRADPGHQGLSGDLREDCTSCTAARSNLKILQGTGNSSDATAARADAIKAADEMKAFAVVGGPTQTNGVRRRADVARRHVHRQLPHRPAAVVLRDAPRPVRHRAAPRAAQRTTTVEFISKQLKGKDAQSTRVTRSSRPSRGSSRCSPTTRSDGQFKPMWDHVREEHEGRGHRRSRRTSPTSSTSRRRRRTRARSSPS